MTAVSASFGFRPRFSVKLRKNAVASLLIFFRNISSTGTENPPGSRMGVEAPVCVPGAMAATSAESKIKNPAEAPRDPVGDTKTTTGTGDSRMW